MRHVYVLGLSLLAAAGCKRSEEKAPSPPPVLSSVAATKPRTGDAGAPTITNKLGASPNLLDLVPARVAVSSTVENPRDFPEFLVDGKMDTAWNGKTGDLAGGFIAFRVPADARVKRIEMTAGYDRIKGDVDLFTANHRITKLRISRDGAVVRELALDPNVRGLQSVPIDGPGGDYELKVLATVPGTKKDWKELAVSELRVVGEPGREKRSPNEPLRVVVGKLDQEPDVRADYELADVSDAPSRDVKTLCDDFVKRLAGTLHEREERARENDLKLGAPSCAEAPLGVPFTGDATYKRALLVKTSDGISTGIRLAVELARGLVVTPIGWSIDDPTDPGCPSIVRTDGIEALRIENGHLLAVLQGNRGSFDEKGTFAPVKVRDAMWCKDASSKLSCKWYMAQYRAPLTHFAVAPDGTMRLQGSAVEVAP